MNLFIFSALTITALTLLMLVIPLLKTRNTVSYARQAQNIHFAKERLQELEAQLKNASISATDYEALKLEIENNLAHDIDITNQSQTNNEPAPPRSDKTLIIALCLLLPVSATGLYISTGTPSAFELVNNTSAPASREIRDIASMVKSIEQRLLDNPKDSQGWAIISRTYLTMGRYADAKQGFLKLLELEGKSADVYASLADASGLLANGNLAGEPTGYVEQALALQPRHPQALWLAGLSAAQQNNLEQASVYWNQLLPLLDDTPQQQQLRDIIQQTFDEQPNEAPDKKSVAAETSPGLTINVDIATEIHQQINPSDPVFIFARAKNGPPAPLAVKRLTAADLPIEITLSDADAMMEQFKLSLFEDVVISARVAKSGNPIAQPGDIQSATVEAKSTTREKIALIISETIK